MQSTWRDRRPPRRRSKPAQNKQPFSLGRVIHASCSRNNYYRASGVPTSTFSSAQTCWDCGCCLGVWTRRRHRGTNECKRRYSRRGRCVGASPERAIVQFRRSEFVPSSRAIWALYLSPCIRAVSQRALLQQVVARRTDTRTARLANERFRLREGVVCGMIIPTVPAGAIATDALNHPRTD
jgi:hypothetical protein